MSHSASRPPLVPVSRLDVLIRAAGGAEWKGGRAGQGNQSLIHQGSSYAAVVRPSAFISPHLVGV